jgi:hypothetical protein
VNTGTSAQTIGGVVTAANINQVPVMSTKTLGSRFSGNPNWTWIYTGEYITITVPAGANRNYRIGLRQMVLGNTANWGNTYFTLSTSNSSVVNVPSGIGTGIVPTNSSIGWASYYSEGYVTLAPGTYTYYVMMNGSNYSVQLANAISDGSGYCNIMAWPM